MKLLQIFSASFQTSAIFCMVALILQAPFHQSGADVDLASSIYLLSIGLTFLSSVTSDKKGGVDFLIAFFFLFMIAIPAKAQISAETFPWFADLSPQYISLTFGLLAASQLFYIMGQSLSLRRPIILRETSALTNRSGLFYTKWAWGIASFAILCACAAGPGNLLVARFETARADFGNFTLQFLFMARSTSLLALVLLISLARFLPHGRLRRQNLVAIFLFAPLFLVINFPPALPRFVLLGTVIAVSCCYVNYTRPAVKTVTSLVAVLFLFFVFPFTKLLAQDGFSFSAFFSVLGTTNISYYLLRVDFDGFMQTVSAVQYLQEGIGGIRWGNNFLGVLLFFVPRGLWPSKPIDTGEIVSVSLGYWYNNVACPLPAEALMGFGLIGPLLVFGSLGYVVSRIEISAALPIEGTPNLPSFVLYTILMGFIVIILRGALNGVAPQFASGFLMFAIMMAARRYGLVWKQS